MRLKIAAIATTIVILASCGLGVVGTDSSIETTLPMSASQRFRLYVDADGTISGVTDDGVELVSPEDLEFLEQVWPKLPNKESGTYYLESSSGLDGTQNARHAGPHYYQRVDHAYLGHHSVSVLNEDGLYDTWECRIYRDTYECYYCGMAKKLTWHSINH